MRLAHFILILFLATVAFLVWLGVGYGIVWLLDAGLNVDVNKPVFIKAGMVIGVVNGAGVLLVGLIQNLTIGKFSKRFPKKYF